MLISNTKNRPYGVSVVVPFLNERENLEQLYQETLQAMSPTQLRFEIIFVDDGSSDGSSALIEAMAKKDPRVKLIQLTRNFGQTAAMAAGFKQAQGEIYVAMDADNQNDPKDIPTLLEKLEEGYDVASGWRKSRKDKWLTRRLPSQMANGLISMMTGVRLHDYGCSLKAYRAEYVDSIELYGEMHRFIPAYASMVGAKVAEVVVNHRPRVKGESKYGLARIFKVMMDLITVKFLLSFATKPSYLFGGIGSFLCLAGLASAVEVLVEKYWAGTFAHRNPFLLLAVFLFFLGVQFILMGLIAELQIRTYHQAKGKPGFLIKKTINISTEEPS